MRHAHQQARHALSGYIAARSEALIESFVTAQRISLHGDSIRTQATLKRAEMVPSVVGKLYDSEGLALAGELS